MARPKIKLNDRRLRFKQSEIERAVRGALRMGLTISSIVIDPVAGRITVATASSGEPRPPTSEG